MVIYILQREEKILNKRQLFIFWQFGGNNKSYCNQVCPYCYGGKKENRHYWNGDVAKWEQAFVKLDSEHGGAGIYFVMSYGESMGMHGFYEAADMIGRHPTWTLCMVTNLSFDPARLVATQLAKTGRLMLHPCWHPLGMADGDMVKGWERFKKHLLMLRAAKVPFHVLFCWYPPQIKLFPDVFDWLDANNIRVNVRRYIDTVGGLKIGHYQFFGKKYPKYYSDAELGYIYANTCPKVTKYGLDLTSPKGRLCTAGMNMILIKPNGDTSLCADTEFTSCLGNIFDGTFKLATQPCRCPNGVCGGDYGMLHLMDSDFGDLPKHLPNEPFLSIAECSKEGQPVPYPKRTLMLSFLDEIRRGK
jgi:hypothetical protein